MKLILEYGQFTPEYKPITLYIKGQKPIVISAEKSKEKELLVRSIIRQIYPNFRGNQSFEFGGVTISGELLNKAQKNIAILYEIVDIAKSEGVKIQTADELINFIYTHSQDLFNSEGIFFNRVYGRLGGATNLGRDKELEANEFFKEYASSRGIKVELKSPESYQQDIAGVDAYFEYNGSRYTIQTKTLSSIRQKDSYYIIYISGYFTRIKTNYFVLIPKNTNETKYIFKGKNVTTEIDENGVNYYIVPTVDLLYSC